VSALAWGFLAAVSKLEHWVYATLPAQLGLGAPPAWWPFPVLAAGGLVVGAAIRYLPGTGGHSPADGFQAGGVFPPNQLPGVLVAALATLASGAVLGPEAPLIALGGGLAAWAVSRAKGEGADRAKTVIAAAGSFAAVSTLFGSPLIGAFLMMEVVGLGGAALELVLVPGLLAAGIGALVFTGLGRWSGLGTFSLAIHGLPHFARPSLTELGWGILIGLAAAILSAAIRQLGLRLRPLAQRKLIAGTVIAGLVVAALAAGYTQITGKSDSVILFSGQNQLAPFVDHQASFGVSALILLILFKGLGYGVSLSSFRGGPTFPAIFIGAVGGALLAHLPGLPLVPAIGMGIAAMTAAMLRLPLTAALLAVLLLVSDAAAVAPLVIIAVVIAYIASAHLDNLAGKGS
jgi:H+/Cl- antiporter ClcA